jgi:hypothetical protein
MARTKITIERGRKYFTSDPATSKDLEGRLFDGAIQLDPNHTTSLCTIGETSSMIGRIDGQWAIAPGQPFFGPSGNTSVLLPNGFHQFSAVVVAWILTEEGLPVIVGEVEDDAEDGWKVDNGSPSIVFVGVFMNGSTGKAVNNPANPMRATLGVAEKPILMDVNVNTCSVNPSTVALGDQSILTVTLDAPAPSGGITVIVDTNFSGDDDLKDTPQAIGIEQGQSTGQFTLQTQDVDASGNPILNPSTQITFIAHITPVAEPGDKTATLNITSGEA